ncbi:MAG: FAD-dependent oxidoreductase, partial [Ginsengibacter sp.]
EKETKINFHTPVGCLYVNPNGSDNYLEQAAPLGKNFNARYSRFEDGNSLNTSYPDFHFPASSKGLFEDAPSGYINPRLLIKAQLEVCVKNNGTILNYIVEDVIHENTGIKIITREGKNIRANKALVAAGAFTNSLNLLDKKLFFRLKSETTIWGKVSNEEAHRLNTLPSLLYEIDTPEIQNIYLIQPVQYPDGAYYLKMGANISEDIYFESLEDMQKWFCSVDTKLNLQILQKALMQIMPGINVKEFVTKKCIVTRTKHGKPYVGSMNRKGLFVAAGGNGYGAMSSDALGHIAAHLLIKETFPEEFDEKDFEPSYAINSNIAL